MLSMETLSEDLSLRQLEYLVAVVDLGTLSRAAARLHVTQPTVSHQLALLERRLGVPLFERVGRGVRPTEAARTLARAGRLMLESGRRGVEAARQAGQGDDHLAVGLVASLAATILPPVLAAWRQDNPDGEVRVREYLRREELVDALERGEVDVAIGPPPEGWVGPMVELGDERYVLVVPPTSRWVGRRRPLPLAALAEEPWVLFDTDHGLHAVVEGACADAGFSPRPAVRTRQIDTAVRLAAAGLGPALVPAISVAAEHAALVVRPSPALTRPVAMFGPGLGRTNVQDFLGYLTKERSGLE